jgi:fucose 4-O-acetylase-like acetyltransferase
MSAALRSAAPTVAGRSALLDRAKGVLILLVVLGHAIEVTGAPAHTIALYGAIYLFHMPAFFLVAGTLVRRRPFADELRLVFTRLCPPYLFGALAAALVAGLLGRAAGLTLLPPPWTLWFLLSLATLRLARSLLSTRSLLTVSIIVAAIASVVALPGELSLGRTAALAVFFALGAALGPDGLATLARRIGGRSGIVLLVTGGLVGLAVLALPELPRSTLFWRDPFTVGGLAPAGAILASLALHLGALGASFGAIALIGALRLPAWVELLGRESLAIYLGHAIVLAALRPTLRAAEPDGVVGLLVIGALTVGATVLPLLVTRVTMIVAPPRLARTPPAR